MQSNGGCRTGRRRAGADQHQGAEPPPKEEEHRQAQAEGGQGPKEDPEEPVSCCLEPVQA